MVLAPPPPPPPSVVFSRLEGLLPRLAEADLELQRQLGSGSPAATSLSMEEVAEGEACIEMVSRLARGVGEGTHHLYNVVCVSTACATRSLCCVCGSTCGLLADTLLQQS